MKVNLAVGCANKRMENSSFLLTSVSCWPKDVWHSWNVLIVLLSLLQVFCLDATRWAYWVRGHTCPWIHSTCLSRALSYSSYFPVRLCCDPSVRWSALTIYFDMCGAQSQQWMCYCMNDPSRLCLQSEDRAFSLPPPPACSLSNYGRTSVCQLWSASITSLLLLQSDPSSFLRSFTFGRPASLMPQRGPVNCDSNLLPWWAYFSVHTPFVQLKFFLSLKKWKKS